MEECSAGDGEGAILVLPSSNETGVLFGFPMECPRRVGLVPAVGKG